ncbi:hypothetical protein CDG24_25255 [Salmonella enterica subsp. enterica serovar Newport]|nr:hypothetical protein [Salmonella enterica subsp. enterica serovar Newport]
MAGKRAAVFAALLKQYREELKLSRDEVIGFFAVSTEIPGFVRTKAKRIIQRAERKAKREAESKPF